MTTAKVYVGYDSRDDIAWQVCRHSIRRHSGDAFRSIVAVTSAG